jgi:hypothetical protein
MDGIASRVRRDVEGGATVLRFLVTADDGSRAAVEMRGVEIHGILDDRDRVSFGHDSLPAGGIHRPTTVLNLTTGAAVSSWRPSLIQRAGKPLLTMVSSAVVSSLVTLIFTTSLGSSGESAAPGDDDADAGAAVAFVVIVGVLLWIVWLALFGLRGRRRGKPLWPVTAGFVVGVGTVAIVVGANA